MLLSIITATRNRVSLLEKNYYFLKKNKNFLDFEWVIVCEYDDFKTINFLNKIKNEKYIRVIKGRFKSADRAYNYGFKKARGKYVNIHGDDDFFSIKNFKLIRKCLLSDREWIIGQAEYVNNDFKKIRILTTFIKNFLLEKFNVKTLMVINFIMTPSIFFKKKLIRKVGGYDSNILYGSDYIFWLKFNRFYKPLVINENLSYVIFNSKTKTGSYDLTRYIVFLKQMKKYASGPFIRVLQFLSILTIVILNFILKKILKIY